MCAACLAKLQPRVENHSMLSAKPTPHLVSLGRHAQVLKRVTHAFKYGSQRELAPVLGGLLASGIPADWNIQAVSAVPMHSRRQRERGYNQAELLAQEVARALGVPYLETLERRWSTRQQAKLSGAQRQHNLDNAFALATPRYNIPRPLLLVDDVTTTGATLLACREVLKEAGIEPIYYAVLSR